MAPAYLSVALSLLAVLPSITAHDHAAPVPNGIIGFGISLYQDNCCQSCKDSLKQLYLNCTTFPDGFDPSAEMSMEMMGGDMSMMPETSDECYASNTPWLQTMAYCIQDRCNADAFPADKQAECFSTYAVGGAEEPTMEASLPPSPPTEEVAADAKWLNTTSLVNQDLYYSTHGTYFEFARSEYFHTRYG